MRTQHPLLGRASSDLMPPTQLHALAPCSSSMSTTFRRELIEKRKVSRHEILEGSKLSAILQLSQATFHTVKLDKDRNCQAWHNKYLTLHILTNRDVCSWFGIKALARTGFFGGLHLAWPWAWLWLPPPYIQFGHGYLLLTSVFTWLPLLMHLVFKFPLLIRTPFTMDWAHSRFHSNLS